MFVSSATSRRLPRRFPAVALLLVLAGLWGAACCASALQAYDTNELDGTVVDTDQEALKEAEFEWYDSENQSLRRIDVEAPADLKNRESDWERMDRVQKQNNSSGSTFGHVLEIIAWVLIAVSFMALAGFLYWAFLNRETSDAAGSDPADSSDEGGLASRVERLPVELAIEKDANLLEQAEALAARGDCKMATICLYGHALIEMDRHHLLQLEKGKTNRQYLRELKDHPELQRSFAELVVAFEEAFFGDYSIDQQRYQQCWNTFRECESRWQEVRPFAEVSA